MKNVLCWIPTPQERRQFANAPDDSDVMSIDWTKAPIAQRYGLPYAAMNSVKPPSPVDKPAP